MRLKTRRTFRHRRIFSHIHAVYSFFILHLMKPHRFAFRFPCKSSNHRDTLSLGHGMVLLLIQRDYTATRFFSIRFVVSFFEYCHPNSAANNTVVAKKPHVETDTLEWRLLFCLAVKCLYARSAYLLEPFELSFFPLKESLGNSFSIFLYLRSFFRTHEDIGIGEPTSCGRSSVRATYTAQHKRDYDRLCTVWTAP